MHPTTRRALRTLPLPIILAVAACSGATPPRLRIVDAVVTERTDEGLVVLLTIEGENPNAEELPLREATYSFVLDGQPVFQGVRSAEATLTRLDTHRFVLPAPVPAEALPTTPGPHRYEVRGSAIYLAKGAIAELLFDTGFSRPTVGFNGAGEVDLADVRPVTPPRLPQPRGPAGAPRDAQQPPADGAR